MARNKVQFQRGLSDVEFERLYGTEDKCREALFSRRWPEGFACPACGGLAHCELAKRALWQCNACRTRDVADGGHHLRGHQARSDGVVPRHVPHDANQAGHLGARAVAAPQRQLQHRLGDAPQAQAGDAGAQPDKPLDGRIEMDDAYLGGERSGGKRGRGSPGKTPFVAAVETTEDGKAHRVKLRRVRRFTKKNIKKITRLIVRCGARVVTDGLGCFNGVADAGCYARADRHRLRPQGRASPCIQGRQHGARQHQERHRCHVPIREQEARPAPARRVRVSLQPPL